MDKDVNQVHCMNLSTLIETINVTYKKWNRLHMVSITLRCIAWAVSFIMAIAGCAYAITSNENWFNIILYTIVSFLVSTIAFGVLILLLKPVLALIRKNEIKTHNELNELENELFDLKLKKLNAQIKEYRFGISDTVLSTLQEYTDYEIEYINSVSRTRELKTEKARICEWKWIKSAALSAILTVALILTFVLFIGLLVIVFLLSAFSYYGNNANYYGKDYYDNYSDNDETVVTRLIEKIFYSDKHIKEELLEINKRLKMILNNQKFTLKEAHDSGFILYETESPIHLQNIKNKIKLPKCNFCGEEKPLMLRNYNSEKVYMCEQCRMQHKGF